MLGVKDNWHLAYLRDPTRSKDHNSMYHPLHGCPVIFCFLILDLYLLNYICTKEKVWDKSDKVSEGAKIRNRYNQVPHLTQDTNGKVTDSQ